METIPAAVSGGGVTGLILVIGYIIYKCCERRSSRCHAACIDFNMSDGVDHHAVTARTIAVAPSNVTIV